MSAIPSIFREASTANVSTRNTRASTPLNSSQNVVKNDMHSMQRARKSTETCAKRTRSATPWRCKHFKTKLKTKMMMKVHEGVRYNRNSCKSYPGLVGLIPSHLSIRFKDTEEKMPIGVRHPIDFYRKLNRECIYVEDEGFNAAEFIKKISEE
jgi:hypothetical protein